jgi:hypothetical protein
MQTGTLLALIYLRIINKGTHMRKIILSSIFSIVCITNTGCTSTSLSDSLAQIEQEENQQQGRTVNKKVLQNIQALRLVQKVEKQTYTFKYDLNNKELSYSDKVAIAQLLAQQPRAVINIAPAKGTDNFAQLKLSIERAKILGVFASRFTTNVTINFSPKLSTDTLNIVVGA